SIFRDCQYRTRHAFHYICGMASVEKFIYSCGPMRPHNNEVGVHQVCQVVNFCRDFSHPYFALIIEIGITADSGSPTLQFFKGLSAHGLCVKGEERVLVEWRAYYVEKQERSRTGVGKGCRIAGGVLRAGGEVDRNEVSHFLHGAVLFCWLYGQIARLQKGTLGNPAL